MASAALRILSEERVCEETDPDDVTTEESLEASPSEAERRRRDHGLTNNLQAKGFTGRCPPHQQDGRTRSVQS
ncbi:unnamed protein product [Gadus morhua 'NCC']